MSQTVRPSVSINHPDECNRTCMRIAEQINRCKSTHDFSFVLLRTARRVGGPKLPVSRGDSGRFIGFGIPLSFVPLSFVIRGCYFCNFLIGCFIAALRSLCNSSSCMRSAEQINPCKSTHHFSFEPFYVSCFNHTFMNAVSKLCGTLL